MLTSKLKGMGKDFLLQTSADDQSGKGTCTLFEGGNPIDVVEFPLPENGRQAVAILDEQHKARQERFNRVSELYDELAQETDVSILLKLAVSLIDQKLYEAAAKVLGRAAKQAPRNSKVFNILGLTWIEIEDFEKAGDAFRKALEINPDFPDYQNNLGRALLLQGKCHEAAVALERAIALNVYYAEAYYNLAMVLVLNGMKREDYQLSQNLEERAMAMLAKAAGFNPSFKTQHLQNALESLKEEKHDEAFIELARGYDLAAKGKFPKKTYHFHLEYLFRNDLLREETVVKHIKNLNRQLEQHPNYADLFNELGLAYTALAQFHSDRAIEAYQKALQLNPEYKAAMKNLKLIQNELKGLKTLLKAILK